MIKVSAKGLSKQLQELKDIEQKAMPYAAAAALTKTAVGLRQALTSEMGAIFDRPTPFTLRAFEYHAATREKLEARVWLRETVGGNKRGSTQPPSVWLQPQIFGGPRADKGSERQLRRDGLLPVGKYVVPGKGAQLDQYGNIKRGDVTKALAGIKKKSSRYFVMYRDKKPIGIGQRTARGKGGMSVLLAFVDKPTYSKRLPFHQVAEQYVEQRLPGEFEKALNEMIKRFAR
jgi:hypothetical protein